MRKSWFHFGAAVIDREKTDFTLINATLGLFSRLSVLMGTYLAIVELKIPSV